VIMAGYENDINMLFEANEGLRRRFPTKIEFPDYSDDELVQIFARYAQRSDYQVSEAALDRFRRLIPHPRPEQFGNAGDVENVFNEARSRLASRIRSADAYESDDLSYILPEDLPEKWLSQPSRQRVGFARD